MKTRGFTLIELLIVVAIIAILAAIAVPNFLEAQTRAKVARMESDLRNLDTAIASYHVDNNRYPRQGPEKTCNIALEGLPELTTPIAYLTSYPVDIFHTTDDMFTGRTGPQPLLYGVCNSGSKYFYLWSYGPDTANQFAMELYDPTNGTVSSGDVKRSSASDLLLTLPQ